MSPMLAASHRPARRLGNAAITTLVAACALGSASAAAAPKTIHEHLLVTVTQPKSAVLAAPRGASAVKFHVMSRSCARKTRLVLAVKVDGKLVGYTRLRGATWRKVRLLHAIGPGDHAVELSARGHKSCPGVLVDELTLKASAPVAAAPAPAAVAPARTPLGPRRAIPLGAAMNPEAAYRLDFKLDSTFLNRFDGLTPENALKMTYVMPERKRFDFSDSDRLIDFATQHVKGVRGHTLLWHEQLPPWLTGRRWSRNEMLDVMRDWIGTTVGRYAWRIADWDVVNEPFDAGGNWRKSPWFEALGPDMVEQSLRMAHAADPNAHLYINEFDIEAPGPKQEALYNLVKGLKARGVPLDGIGIQMHWTHDRLVAESTLLATFRRFAALGLHVQITEMDISARGGYSALNHQRDGFAMAGRVCQSVSTCDRVTVWGVSDRDSWRDESARPLLFDGDFNEKPGYAALRNALNAG